MENQEFCQRLTKLRMNKGVSSRDMSLSIGQSPSYINNIENGVNLPSMHNFFYICEYLDVTPKEFFDFDTTSPGRLHELITAAAGLSDEQLAHLITIVQDLRR